MATDSEYSIVYCTAPDTACARRLAEWLIEQRLAACVSILPDVLSIYPWQGNIETEQEQLLMIKTRSDRFDDLAAGLRQQHPYELPEIIAVSIVQGLPEYLQWIDQSVTNTP